MEIIEPNIPSNFGMYLLYSYSPKIFVKIVNAVP